SFRLSSFRSSSNSASPRRRYSSISKVVGQSSMDLFESQHGVAVHDAFRRQTAEPAIDNRVQRDSRASDAVSAVNFRDVFFSHTYEPPSSETRFMPALYLIVRRITASAA